MTEWKIATVSDIHLGSLLNPASQIIKNLNRYLTRDFLNGVDILFLAGDVFDRLISNTEDDIHPIVQWIVHLLVKCQETDTIVRVLEGTPSHDRRQSKFFQSINQNEKIQADLKYVDTLSVEFIEKLNMHVLYIPDEWNRKNETTLEEARNAIAAQGLDKVDFAIMHGHFDCQVPAHLGMKCHDSKAYLNLVRYLIFIGHDHRFFQHDRIVAQGSFDRIGHNQEEAKGFVKAVVSKTGQYQLTFIENIDAKVFKTVDVKETLDDTFEMLNDLANQLPVDSAVRLRGEKTHPIFANMNALLLRYPSLNITKKILDDSPNKELVVQETPKFEVIHLLKGNLKSLLMERLTPKIQSEEDKQFAEAFIEQTL